MDKSATLSNKSATVMDKSDSVAEISATKIAKISTRETFLQNIPRMGCNLANSLL